MITSHGLKVSFPTELSAERTPPSLALNQSNQTQTFLDHSPLGCLGTGFERCRHKTVVDDDIRSHNVYIL
jgi:hypothetical protein